MTNRLSLAIESAMMKRVRKVEMKDTPPLFYSVNTHGIQVWYSLSEGKIWAHLQDGEQVWSGGGTSYKRALKVLENTAPVKYHHTVNYMRVVLQSEYEVN